MEFSKRSDSRRVAGTRATVDALNFQSGGRIAGIVGRVNRVRDAIGPLSAQLGDSSIVVSFSRMPQAARPADSYFTYFTLA